MATLAPVADPTIEITPAQAPDQAPATPTPQAPTQPRLSEVLRTGSAKVGQAFKAFVDRDGNMCALGTVWHEMGYDMDASTGIGGFILEHPEWGFLAEPVNTAPLREGVCTDLRGCKATDAPLGDLVMHFNDEHKMSREDIASRLSQFGL